MVDGAPDRRPAVRLRCELERQRVAGRSFSRAWTLASGHAAADLRPSRRMNGGRRSCHAVGLARCACVDVRIRDALPARPRDASSRAQTAGPTSAGARLCVWSGLVNRFTADRWFALGGVLATLGITAAAGFWIHTLTASGTAFWTTAGIASVVVTGLGLLLVLVGFFMPGRAAVDAATQSQRGGEGSVNLQAGNDIRIGTDKT